MKTTYIDINNTQKYTTILLAILLIFLINACSDEEECGYGIGCIEECILFEDFEDEQINTSGNWLGLSLNSNGVRYVNRGGSIALEANDGSGGSWAYNITDFPNNLLAQGCELQFDIEYESGGNGAIATNAIFIFDGTSPISSTNRARFILSPGIPTSTGFQTIAIPLELASSTTLPSNSFGEWTINGMSNSSPPTSSDILNFNNLIQNISGIGFYLDVNFGNPPSSGPSEVWWFDNFCFKQCCD